MCHSKSESFCFFACALGLGVAGRGEVVCVVCKQFFLQYDFTQARKNFEETNTGHSADGVQNASDAVSEPARPKANPGRKEYPADHPALLNNQAILARIAAAASTGNSSAVKRGKRSKAALEP